jgi:hypothetical protein
VETVTPGSREPVQRKQEALLLAEELLSDIELSRLAPAEIVRKASRLARITDDEKALKWLTFEVTGYPSPLTPEASQAARRSGRVRMEKRDEGLQAMASTRGLAALRADADACMAELSTPTGTAQNLAIENSRMHRRNGLLSQVGSSTSLIEKVVGAVHLYVSGVFHSLRFGAAAETAFEVVRREVDAGIQRLVPDALPMLSAAFERASSENPEDWASAAATCRRLLKKIADAVRPPGPDVGGRKMGPENYVNRLVAWIEERIKSGTLRDHVVADLEYLGRRLDAADAGGHKGAHAEVQRFDAARFVAGTYLLVGDILRAAPPDSLPGPEPGARPTGTNGEEPLPEGEETLPGSPP